MKEKKVTREKNLEVLLGEFRNKHEEYFGWSNISCNNTGTSYGLSPCPETIKECKKSISTLKNLIEFYNALSALINTYPFIFNSHSETLSYTDISLSFYDNSLNLQFGKDYVEMGIVGIKTLLNYAERMLSEVMEIQKGLSQKVYQKHYSDFVWVMGNRAVKESKV